MGLAQAGDDPALQQQWAQQTGEWVAQWGANTLLSLGTTLMSGFLGLFGAEGLMNSPYLAAVGKTVGHFGNLAGQMSQPAGTGTGGGLITLSDGTVIDTSTMTAVSGTGTVPGGPGAVPFQVTPEMLQQLYSSGALTPAAQRAIEFAQTHAVGQPYDYSGVGPGTGSAGGYDCSESLRRSTRQPRGCHREPATSPPSRTSRRSASGLDTRRAHSMSVSTVVVADPTPTWR